MKAAAEALVSSERWNWPLSIRGGGNDGKLKVISASSLGIIGDGLADIAPTLRAAFAAGTRDIEFEPGRYMFGSQVEMPTGTVIRGAGRATVFSPLPTFGPRIHLQNALLTTEPNSEDVRVSDLMLDGLGETILDPDNLTESRVHGLVMRRTLNFDVRRVHSVDWWGYAFWGSGDDPVSDSDRHCSGLFEDCYAENSDVLYEMAMCRGITVRNCRGSSGRGTLPCEDAFLAWHGAEDVLWEDCHYAGNAGSGIAAISIGLKPVKNIVFRRCSVHMSGATMAIVGGWHDPLNKPFRVELKVEDCDISSALGAAAYLKNVDATFRNSRLRGYDVCVGLDDTANILFEDTEILASNNPTGSPMAHALRLEAGSSVQVVRGALRARGKTPVAYIKNDAATLSLSPQTILEPS